MTLALRLMRLSARIQPGEGRAVVLAFLCNFILLASYYILRPLRDTMATVFGADQLQDLFTGTFFFTLICAPLYAAAVARVKLSRFLPGLFWLWLVNILVFYVLFRVAPHSRWVAAAYFWWFSVVNLFLISVFWTLMSDIFLGSQAERLFALIAAGGSTGAIAGPLITKLLVGAIGVDGLLLVAAVGFLAVIGLVHALVREKARLRAGGEAQATTLGHSLPGNPLRGFGLLLRSRLMLGEAAFMFLMTWIATLVYVMQTGLIARAFPAVESRAIAFADVDLAVNIAAALILIFGLGRLLTRFGATAGLVLNPILMAGAFAGIALAPSLAMVQAARGLQRVTQYAIARPSREIAFTVVDQETRYKAKNVIDTVVYRFGDLSAAWMQAGLGLAGVGVLGVGAIGIAASAVWGVVALDLGRRYQALRRAPIPANMTA